MNRTITMPYSECVRILVLEYHYFVHFASQQCQFISPNPSSIENESITQEGLLGTIRSVCDKLMVIHALKVYAVARPLLLFANLAF